MKKLLITPLLLLLSSCGLLFEPSQDVIQAQQTAYIGISKLEQNYDLLLEEYEAKLKALVLYVYTHAYQPRIDAAETEEERQALMDEQAQAVNQEFDKIEEGIQRWRDIGASGHGSAKGLVEAVYEYLTTTSVSTADIADLIDSSLTTWDKVRNN
jgi:glutamate synthase domain-containing protein 2